MARKIFIVVDNDVIERKDKTQCTHEELYLIGLCIAEKDADEAKDIANKMKCKK